MTALRRQRLADQKRRDVTQKRRTKVAKLTFFGMMISLDGYINDAKGRLQLGADRQGRA
jgi:hypothetical protein